MQSPAICWSGRQTAWAGAPSPPAPVTKRWRRRWPPRTQARPSTRCFSTGKCREPTASPLPPDLRAALGERQPPAIVMVTAADRELLQRHALAGAVDAVLAKPVTASAMYNADRPCKPQTGRPAAGTHSPPRGRAAGGSLRPGGGRQRHQPRRGLSHPGERRGKGEAGRRRQPGRRDTAGDAGWRGPRADGRPDAGDGRLRGHQADPRNPAYRRAAGGCPDRRRLYEPADGGLRGGDERIHLQTLRCR